MSGPRPDLTAAVLLWNWDQVLADMDASAGGADRPKAVRAVSAAKSELLRLGLIDDMGRTTKEGRRLLGLI